MCDAPSVVTIEFQDEDGSTRLVLQHDLLPPEARASHEGGWGAMLDRLSAVIAPNGSREGAETGGG